MTDDEYRAHPAFNWSRLKLMHTSPAAYRHGLDAEDKDTASRRFGRLVHLLVLEPERAATGVAVWRGPGTRATKAYKEWAAALPPGVEEVTEAEYDKAQAMADAVLAHPVAGPLLTGGLPEVPIVWVGEGGRQMKAKLDCLITADDELAALLGCAPMDCIVVDLKTVGSVDPRKMARHVADSLYHGQLAHYAAAVRALGETDVSPVAVIVGVETAEPHDVGVFILGHDDALYAGELLRADLLRRLDKCEAADHWPGKVPAAVALDLPGWAPGFERDDNPGDEPDDEEG